LPHLLIVGFQATLVNQGRPALWHAVQQTGRLVALKIARFFASRAAARQANQGTMRKFPSIAIFACRDFR
jgi:hypothetical protein